LPQLLKQPNFIIIIIPVLVFIWLGSDKFLVVMTSSRVTDKGLKLLASTPYASRQKMVLLIYRTLFILILSENGKTISTYSGRNVRNRMPEFDANMHPQRQLKIFCHT
jgi:hypothetical protein